MDTPPRTEKSFRPRINLRQPLSAQDLEQVQARATWANQTGHNPSVPTQPQPQATSTPTPIRIDPRQGCTVRRALKGDDQKKACLVDIGATTWFVKGGAGNDKDHEDASDMIRRLELPGVTVPRTRALTDAERDAIAKVLDNGGPDAKQLADSLRAQRPVNLAGDQMASSGRISELCGGQPLSAGFPTVYEAAGIQDAIDCYKRIQGMSQDAAWKDAFEELKKAKDDKDKTLEKNKDRWGAATDAQTRREAIAWFRKNPPNGSTAAGQKRLRRIDVIEHVSAGTVVQACAALEKEQRDAEALAAPVKAFASSPAGIQAFAGVAAADLVCGMDDRVLGKFNGGNFHFDDATKSLLCVDNHKDVFKSLEATDPQRWLHFVSAQNASTETVRLEDALFARIYAEKDDSNSWVPGNYCQFTDQEKAAAKTVFRTTLAEVASKVESDLAASDAARARGRWLKIRLQIEECLMLGADLEAPPILPKEANAIGKTGHKMKMLTQGGIADATKAIKTKLRDGTITAEDARKQLLALQEQRDGLKKDRRSEKIEFLIKAATLCQTLKNSATTLASIVPNAPAGCWTNDHPTLLEPMSVIVNVWLDRAKKDKKTSAQIAAAWKSLYDVVQKLS